MYITVPDLPFLDILWKRYIKRPLRKPPGLFSASSVIQDGLCCILGQYYGYFQLATDYAPREACHDFYALLSELPPRPRSCLI